MEELKIVLVSNHDLNSTTLLTNLYELSFENISMQEESGNIMTVLKKNDFDFIFLNVDFLGFSRALKIAKEIEQYIGKPYLLIGSKAILNKNASKFETFKNNLSNFISFDISKFDLLNEIIEELNNFNSNLELKNLKCYDFLYVVTDEIEIKKVETESIAEVFKDSSGVYLKVEEDTVRIIKAINMTFFSLFKSLSKNFAKSGDYKIINKMKECVV